MLLRFGRTHGGLSTIAVERKEQNAPLAHKIWRIRFYEMNRAAETTKQTTRPGCHGLLASARWIAGAACLSFPGAVCAADLDFVPPPATAYPESAGVPCSIGAPFWAPLAATASVLPWRSVWLGHFSGGREYDGATGKTLVDWRDEKICFPSRQQCDTWISGLRKAYHRPEGYWTCLLLR